MDKYRAVFHLDEGARARAVMTLANIENLLADLGEDRVEVELVANGEGILALLKSPNLHGAHVEKLAARGVRFLACANSLRQMGVAAEALLDVVEVVPAGVGELVRRQAEGWAYVRP